MTAPSRSDRPTIARRRRWRPSPDERGATLILGAIMMLVLVAFVGFAVDVGLVVNERRQEQAAVDTATLSGAREALLNNATDQTIFNEVTRLSHENMDNPPSLADWRTDFEQCTDPDRVAAGFTVPLALSGGVSVDCISFDATRSEVRVKLPTTTLPTTFATVLGFDTWSVSAFAEAGLAEGVGNPNILPFSLSTSSSGSGMTCLKTQTFGQAVGDCLGSVSGNFGYLAMPRPTDPTNQKCNGGFGNIVMNNIAQGADHEMGVRTSDDGGVTFTNSQIDDLCPRIGLGLQPNHVFTETGVTNAYLQDGMVEGSSNITDGQGARLTRTTWELSDEAKGYFIDDRPLWEFFDVGLSSGGAVNYNGAPLSPNSAPTICDPAVIRSPATTAQGYRLRIDNCFAVYDLGVGGIPFTGDLFNRDANANGRNDILETPRFSWLPEAWQDLNAPGMCNGSNCDYDIKQFRPVFIQDLYYTQGNKYWLVPPGPGNLVWGTSSTVSGNAGLRGVSAFVFNYELFPQEVLDEGPLAGQYDLVEIALTR